MRMNTPSFSSVYSVDFPSLSGGLNLRDLGYLVDKDESPSMKNLIWRNGLLQSRDGQRKVASVSYEPYGVWPPEDNPCYAVYDSLFHGYAFFHVGSSIQCLDMSSSLTDAYDEDNPIKCTVISGNMQIKPGRGTFFRYQNALYYKNAGGFYVITRKEEGTYQPRTEKARFQVYPSSRGVQLFDVFASGLNGNTAGGPLTKLTSEYSLEDLDGACIVLRHRDTGLLLRVGDYTDSDIEDYTIEAGVMSISDPPTGTVFSIHRTDRPITPTEQEQDAHIPPEERIVLGLQSVSYPPETSTSSSAFYLRGASGDGRLHVTDQWNPNQSNMDSLWYLDWYDVSGTALRNDYAVALRNLGVSINYGENYTAGFLPAHTIPASPFLCSGVVTVASKLENAPVVVINASPENGSGTLYQPENRLSGMKTVWYNAVAGTSVYHLPVTDIERVDYVEVDGVHVPPTVVSGASRVTNWTVDLVAGTVTFSDAPNPGNPQRNNTVRITYTKSNPEAMRAVLQCKYVTVASGGDAAQYIVLGGCDTQPDAIFWNANDELAIQPWYFPMPCYNLVGTAGDPVTGFGRQYNDTLVFSEHTVGKLNYGTQTVDGRVFPAFGYARVNSKIGCNLPWTIQQVENNVVFCNSYLGACIVLSSSAAYENNIQELSQKIRDDGSASGADINGLIRDIQESTTDVVSFDDDDRYWLCANGKVYAWDYSVSTYAKPSWFYWTDIDPTGLFRDDRHRVYHLDTSGDVQAFLPINEDNGVAIVKTYQFPTLSFGSYARLKDVTDLLITVRSDVASTVAIRYDTDYESREDQTPIIVQPGSNTASVQHRLVRVAKRRPKCRHVRQFGLTLSNGSVGQDLTPVSLQVFYRFTGKER